MTSKPCLHFRPMTAADFAAVIVLGNKVHGDNYLTESNLQDYFASGQQDGCKKGSFHCPHLLLVRP